MAILLSSKNFETSFVVRTDIDRLIEHIRSTAASALPGSPYTVYFLGEAHSNDFDVRRRGGVYEALMDDRRVMLALERTFAKAGDADNMVVESNDLKSADDGRNAQIVGLVWSLANQMKAARTIVFFYGQEHENPIYKHLIRTFDDTVKLNWITCLPVEMALKEKLSYYPSTFSTVGKKPVGYCATSDTDYLLKLLEKGYVLEPFNLELSSGESARSTIFTRSAYAIYFKNETYAAHQRKGVIAEGVAPVKIQRINGAYTVVARKISMDDIPKAEAGTLK